MGRSFLKLKGNGKLTPEQRNELANRYEQGWTFRALSRAFGITRSATKQLVVSRGKEIRKRFQSFADRRSINIASAALRRGDLKRPEACSECFSIGKVHGHHDDYNLPLEVRWLCSKCHADWHSRNVPIASKRQ